MARFQLMSQSLGKPAHSELGCAVSRLPWGSDDAEDARHIHNLSGCRLVQQWQEATRALVNDPAFREKAPAVLGGYLPIIGDKGEQLIKEALQIKPEYRQWLKDWLFDTYQVKIQ